MDLIRLLAALSLAFSPSNQAEARAKAAHSSEVSPKPVGIGAELDAQKDALANTVSVALEKYFNFVSETAGSSDDDCSKSCETRWRAQLRDNEVGKPAYEQCKMKAGADEAAAKNCANRFLDRRHEFEIFGYYYCREICLPRKGADVR